MRSLAIFRHFSGIICRADLAHLEQSESTTNYAKNDEDNDNCGERGRLHAGANFIYDHSTNAHDLLEHEQGSR